MATIANATIEEEEPPEDREFIIAQVFLICSGSRILFSTHNRPLRDGSVNALINKLIEGFCGHANPSVFLLEAALDEDRYRDLLGQGIGEVDLGISGYQQTLEYVTGQGQIPQAGLYSVLSSLVNGAPTQERREAAEKIKGRFILRPGHDWDDVEVKDLLADMALGLLDGDGGDFTTSPAPPTGSSPSIAAMCSRISAAMRHAVLYVTPSCCCNFLPLMPCLEVVNRKFA